MDAVVGYLGFSFCEIGMERFGRVVDIISIHQACSAE